METVSQVTATAIGRKNSGGGIIGDIDLIVLKPKIRRMKRSPRGWFFWLERLGKIALVRLNNSQRRFRRCRRFNRGLRC
eukprot:CAMPEP_0114649144 /NCGR_PEP_ID=MMETSP0191-20121206/6863_1 /TAXON_ID=126664 /ORGANISM="Sorites sp." /LENGTH=78 /DNA_ID=CAMNT_0001862691 /DNA_START=395 /DNA_END=631 /DNA_ORIENTATION=-